MERMKKKEKKSEWVYHLRFDERNHHLYFIESNGELARDIQDFNYYADFREIIKYLEAGRGKRGEYTFYACDEGRLVYRKRHRNIFQWIADMYRQSVFYTNWGLER